MKFTDTNYALQESMHKLVKMMLILLLLCNTHAVNSVFQSGKEYVYSYDALSSSGVVLPSGASSSWGFNGKLKIQAEQNVATMQLESLKMTVWNGKTEEQREEQDIPADVADLLKPFQITYRNGLIENFTTEALSPWSNNIKRSIASTFQLDLTNLEKEVAFHSTERNHYGQCNIEYVANPEGEENEWLIRKFFDPRTCVGHPHYTWSNVPKMLCLNDNQNPILKSSERLYKVKRNESLNEILFINATGGIYVQSFQSFGEAHFHFTRQIFNLISVKDTIDKIPTKDLYLKVLQHELPEVDLTQGRGTPDKNTVLKSIGKLLDRLSQRLENPGLDTEAGNLHNTTINVLLYYLGMLDVTDLRDAYTKFSGTSYKEETIRNMFLEALPQVGTKEAALFILELIQNNMVSDMSAIQLLTQLPFHIRKPDAHLLVNLQALLNLPEKTFIEVQNTAILTYGTLIYKTCLLYCPYEMLDDYVRLYLDKFTETKEYEKKIIWLEGLANIQLGRVVEFLEPIASGNNAESHHFRVLAAWASLPTAPLRPDVIYPVYWPILINRTEYLEMRVAALTLLILSSPTSSRVISLYWYMQSEPNQHLYHYFYTILKSMERTTHPCYVHIGAIAAQFTRVLRPPSNQYLVTGNYLFDYQDTYRKFGAMIHGIVVGNPSTNIPEVLYVTVNTYGNGVNINQISLYIKAEGLLQSLSTHLDGPTQVKDILKQFKLDQKQNGPVHLELIARIQEKTVLCLHLNESTLARGFKFLSFFSENLYYMYQNMEFHVNQQRINVPLTMESVQVTDLGANVRVAITATSLFSMRGNFTYISIGRNNHVILRTSIHKSEIIDNYNPLIDIWHSAERAHSIHGYLPVNITLGFDEHPFISYNTPGEHLKIGITTHARTTTNIQGLNIKSKLQQICSKCPQLYLVTKSPTYKPKTIDLFQFELAELGGHVYVKLFDCENVISREKLVRDVFLAHRANYPIWPFLEFALTALHFLDYYTYIPPKGSCGLTVYVSTIDAQRTQVKFEYNRAPTHHLLALTHRNVESSEILQQWTLAVLYEVTSWVFDTIKIKATKIIPGQKVLKFCLEVEKEIPWDWDFLSTKPTDPAKIALNAIWGYSDTAKGKCDGSSVTLYLFGEISDDQIENAKEPQWPYEECRKQSKGKRFTPFSDACYETSRELSTLRKYQILAKYENIPESLMRLAWKFRAFYDLIGGNSSSDSISTSFTVTATFPKGSDIGELSLNNDKISIEYNYNLINYFLTRTRIHKYMDLTLLKAYYGTCIVTPDHIRSVHNVTYTFHDKPEVLLLGQCYNENPKYALTARNDMYGVNVNIYDETDTLRILANGTGGTLYNDTMHIQIPHSSVFHSLGSKRVKLGSNTIDIIVPNLYLYMHWTQEQILLFFPTYLLEFSCGICALHTSHTNNLYEKL